MDKKAAYVYYLLKHCSFDSKKSNHDIQSNEKFIKELCNDLTQRAIESLTVKKRKC